MKGLDVLATTVADATPSGSMRTGNRSVREYHCFSCLSNSEMTSKFQKFTVILRLQNPLKAPFPLVDELNSRALQRDEKFIHL